MRITILECAKRHSVVEEEIRVVLSYPVLRIRIAPRRDGADPYLFIGRYDENEPLLEVIADLAGSDEWVAFHAMMLRPSTIHNLGLELVIDALDLGDTARQRPERRDDL
ncbi:hypothetical protein [Nocardia blacklockiae]|uniref:hypothetical protein n=1 Tax=Nocardia blacklockiae TaxID=480036 RepID=UPI001893140C|nr:hypothetical protein [Nocardia blacklockiae]MBF6176196.1 hypothetical protein [Nocardia blacklockiae]